jgi:hypothetical protein
MVALLLPIAEIVVVEFEDRFLRYLDSLNYTIVITAGVLGVPAIVCCLICSRGRGQPPHA